MKNNYTVIDTILYCEQQSWYYTEVRKYNDDLMRVEIIRNAYDYQSCVRLDKWMTNGWQTMIAHPIEETPVYSVSYVHKNPDILLFVDTCEPMWALYNKIISA